MRNYIWKDCNNIKQLYHVRPLKFVDIRPRNCNKLMSLAFLTLSLHRQLPDCCIYNAIIIFNFVGCFLLQLHTITTVTRLCWFFYTNITYFTFKIFCFWCINSVQTHFINIYAFSIITTAYVIDFSLHYHIKLTQNLPKYLSIHYKETKKFLNVQRSNKWHKCNSNFFPVFFMFMIIL